MGGLRGESGEEVVQCLYTKFLKTKIKITHFLALLKIISRREAQLD